MQTRAVFSAALGIAAVLTLAGCPSKEGAQGDVQTSSSGAPPAGSGPLANLEMNASVPENWLVENNQPAPMIYFQPQNVRISAQCRQPNGALMCDAIRQLRGPQIEVPRAKINGQVSAGVRACMTAHLPIVNARTPQGEDAFCRFPDGSMVAAGTIELYGLKIVP